MTDAVTKAAEAAADSLHQHGPMRSGPQTPDWRDCPHAPQHEGAGRAAAEAALEAVSYDDLVAVAQEARGVLEAYDQAGEMDWTGALVDTRLRAALARFDQGAAT